MCAHVQGLASEHHCLVQASHTGHDAQLLVYVNANVNSLLAISESDFDNSGEPGPQDEGLGKPNHLETSLRQLHVSYRASSCAKRGGHVQLCLKPMGARGIEPETFRRRGKVSSCPPTTGPKILNKKFKNLDIMPNPSGHRPRRPCAQGRTCAEQE